MKVLKDEKDKYLLKIIGLAFLFSFFGIIMGFLLGAAIGQEKAVFLAAGWGAGGIIGAIAGLGSALVTAIQEWNGSVRAIE